MTIELKKKYKAEFKRIVHELRERGAEAAREWLTADPIPTEELAHFRDVHAEERDCNSTPEAFGWDNDADFWEYVLGEDHEPVNEHFSDGFHMECLVFLSELAA